MSKKALLLVAGLALVVTPAFAGTMMTEFPQAGIYTLHSEPTFVVTVGDKTELVTCKAELVLKTGDAYLTDRGKRRVDLEVVSWHADGASELLGGDMHFRMLTGETTPDQSYVESYEFHSVERASRDFPAHAQFSVPYELETPFGVVSGLYGLTEGTIEAFPPQPGALFKMEKGDTAHLMASLMPAPVSALSAAGEVTPVKVTVKPAACADVETVAN